MAGGKKTVDMKFFDPVAVAAARKRYLEDPEYARKIDEDVYLLASQLRMESRTIAREMLLHGAAVVIQAPIKEVPRMTILDAAQTFVHYINEILPARSPRRKLKLVPIAKDPDPT